MIKLQLDSDALLALLRTMELDEVVELRKGVAGAIAPLIAKHIFGHPDSLLELEKQIASFKQDALNKEFGLVQAVWNDPRRYNITPEGKAKLREEMKSAAHDMLDAMVEKYTTELEPQLTAMVQKAVDEAVRKALNWRVQERAGKALEAALKQLEPAT